MPCPLYSSTAARIPMMLGGHPLPHLAPFICFLGPEKEDSGNRRILCVENLIHDMSRVGFDGRERRPGQRPKIARNAPYLQEGKPDAKIRLDLTL